MDGGEGSALRTKRTNDRRLLAAIALLAALLIAAGATWLAWFGGANPANAALAGGGAFTATVFLMIALIQFLDD
ncbi:hypothetical protein [Micromonospora endophytica]|uniref:hypothetical protein n=1 Tax=Micromonospora endophytica TaxID=515350 RepID=UPI0011B5F171|nr:hypothetical protein [Micromonospora endophytica]BCJ58214.1 hypothetical protein Jiend_16360 [Micromonospora endophytica]